MEASEKFADASILMRKIGFIVVLLRGLLMGILIFYLKRAPSRNSAKNGGHFSHCIKFLQELIDKSVYSM